MVLVCFFFKNTATTSIYTYCHTLSLHDSLPILFESYIDSVAPVGSRTISQLSGLHLSPASIRGVMQELEELGLLAAPYTSAGRMPTDTGLRLFVDGMMQALEPSADERAAIEARIERGSGPIEDALAATTAALSGLSACAGLVFVPKRELVVRQFAFVALSPEQAMAVIVSEDGRSEEHTSELQSL